MNRLSQEYITFVRDLAATVPGWDGVQSRQDLQNAVFDAVCLSGHDGAGRHLGSSENWMESGLPALQANEEAPDFYDPGSLGDWEGHSLGDLQLLLQDVLDQWLVINSPGAAGGAA